MNDFVFMQYFKTMKQLKCNFPNKSLLKSFSVILFEASINLSFQISSISILHDEAQWLVFIIKKRAFIADNIGNIDGGKKSYLIKSTILLFIIESSHVDRLDSIKLLVCFFANKLNLAEAATPQILHNLKILKAQSIEFHKIYRRISRDKI